MDEATRKKVEELYRRKYFYIYRKALVFFGEPTTAHDIVQDVFYKIVVELNKGNEKVFDSRYLLRMTTNLCVDHVRSRKLRTLDGDDVIPRISNGTAKIAPAVLLKEIVEKLPRSLRNIAVFHFIDGFTLDETAALTDVPKRTLQRRVKKIEKIVATIYAEHR